ncbi:MAG TPA: GNAT family N-acetyltransferase [Rariglobus sp.]|nr:GNAT family N-acetyltransferase [Rariglobus sp.]
MKIEPFLPADKDELLQVWWASWHSSSGFHHPLPPSDWAARFDELVKTNDTVVVRDPEKLAGFMMIDRSKKELSQLFVVPERQRTGLGRIMFEHALREMPSGFSLLVMEDSHGPRAFYETFGMSAGAKVFNPFNGRHEIRYTLRPTLRTCVTFAPVTPDDFDELVALRIAAMRESLERVGRFDPERARERLGKSFYPEHTEFILYEGEKIGFYTFRPREAAYQLDHLYVHPKNQSQGIGSYVMNKLLAVSDSAGSAVELGALKESPSNGFYRRHGFVMKSEDEWDTYYLRTPSRPVLE